jgi:SAM-dependent methyltransferase
MDADDWNARYATQELVWTAEPNVFVAAETGGLPPGRALDLACGEGRNAVWLAAKGWDVTGVDFAEAALDKARRLAGERGVTVRWHCADVRSWVPGDDRYDLVLLAYLQLPEDQRHQALAPAVEALAPDGTLLVVAHDRRNLAEGTGGPQDASVLYGPAEVVSHLEAIGVPDLRIERAETVERAVAGAERPALDCVVRARRTLKP